MKKLLALLCVLTCVLGLTACGGDDTVNEYQTAKQEYAEQYAVNYIIPLMEESLANESIMDLYRNDGYTAEEWETVIENNFGVTVDGDAYLTGLSSFESGIEEIGGIEAIGEVTSTIDDDTTVVNVDITGTLKDGQIEIILSNDYFAVLQSVTLNVNTSFGAAMGKAAMNTLLGMGTVFVVLILIMYIIGLFGYIPKLTEKFSKKKEEPKAETPAAAPVVEETETEEADDLELVAVIAAAVAAYEGQTSTDGFVVRSIRKAKRR